MFISCRFFHKFWKVFLLTSSVRRLVPVVVFPNLPRFRREPSENPPRTRREPAVRTPSRVAFHIAIFSKGLRPPTNASTKSPRIENGAAVSPLGGLKYGGPPAGPRRVNIAAKSAKLLPKRLGRGFAHSAGPNFEVPFGAPGGHFGAPKRHERHLQTHPNFQSIFQGLLASKMEPQSLQN